MKNILIIPKVESKHDENYLCIDNNWFIFLNKVFKKYHLEIAPFISIKPDLIILSGGNNLIKKNSKKNDVYRNYLNSKFLNYGIKNNIKIIGICLGAQFIAKKFKSNIFKIKKHVGKHKIFYEKKLSKKKFPSNDIVNSFHDYGINNLGKNLVCLAIAQDKSVELFSHKKYKIIGVMWHPERFKKFKKIDTRLFKEDLWN